MDAQGIAEARPARRASSPTCATTARATRSRCRAGRARRPRRPRRALQRAARAALRLPDARTRRRRSSTCARSATATVPKPELPEEPSRATRRRGRRGARDRVRGRDVRRDLRPRKLRRARASPGPAIVTEFDSTTVVLPGYAAEVDRYFNLLITPGGVSMAAHRRVAEIPDLEVDPVTLDIIENALRHARFEMDAVLFRSAMSPGHPRAARRVPDAHRPARPDGRRPVRRLHQRDDGRLGPGHLPGRRDPHDRPVQVLARSISHTNDWLVLVPIFFEDELVGWSSQFGHQMDAGGRLPGSLPTGAKTIFEEGIIIPPLKIVERGEVQEDVLRLILNNVRLPGDEPGGPVRDHRRLPRRREARDGAVRALRQGRSTWRRCRRCSTARTRRCAS